MGLILDRGFALFASMPLLTELARPIHSFHVTHVTHVTDLAHVTHFSLTSPSPCRINRTINRITL